MVLLAGWLGTPAVGDVQPFVPAKVQVDKLITVPTQPDYNRDVLAPLHQAQAKQAVALAEQQAELAEQQAELDEQQRELERAREVQLAQVSVGGNCATWMQEAGITDVPDAMQIVQRESGCNPCSINPGRHDCSLTAAQITTACGIGQQLPCGKWPHAWNDPVGGLIDMQNYVVARYGSWANAWGYWQVHHNY